mgnify:CR=1 FL=1
MAEQRAWLTTQEAAESLEVTGERGRRWGGDGDSTRGQGGQQGGRRVGEVGATGEGVGEDGRKQR